MQAQYPDFYACEVAAAQSTTATTYSATNLTTPDRIQNVKLPPGGLIIVRYQAIWQNTVASNARAGLFLGANQIKRSQGASAPTVMEVSGPAETNDDGIISTCGDGFNTQGGAGAATEVTTGQIIMNNAAAGTGGATEIFAAAGTYDVSVQFKNNAAGTLTVKNRHLWVEVKEPSPRP